MWRPIQALDGTVIEPLGVPLLTSDEIDAIVAFLETLTDERVLYQRAPFDHPQLFVPNGHPGDSSSTIDADGDGLADDLMVEIPAVGAEGGDPLPGFLEDVFGPFHRALHSFATIRHPSKRLWPDPKLIAVPTRSCEGQDKCT